MDKDSLQRQLEDMEEASERWRTERRRLNAEIDKLETALADAKAEAARKSVAAEKAKADPRVVARVQEAADQKVRKASEEWEGERSKLNSKINRLEGALAEAISRASNPLRVTQSVKEQFELELNRVAKEKTELEQAFLRAKTEWEQEKLKMAGEMVKLRRAAQIMGRPVPAENVPEVNPKVRDLQNQLTEQLAQWNSEREQLVGQIRKLEEAARQWDAERRQLGDHAGQLQQALTQAQAKIETYEVAARKPNPAKEQVQELKRENEALQRHLEESRAAWETAQKRLTSQVDEQQRELQRTTDKVERATVESQKVWEAEQRRLMSQIEQLQQDLQHVSDKRDQVSNEVIDQLRQQYEQRLQEALQQKAKLTEELKNAGEVPQDGDGRLETEAIETEISRVQTQLHEILTVIENPDTELSTVIRKNVEKAELDSYLKGILYALGRK
jgi:DNA repair exonuclease SbcCD ATPase subunit